LPIELALADAGASNALYCDLARGWQSKSVESQIENSELQKRTPSKRSSNPEDLARIRQRENLEMSKVRVLHDLESAQNPRYEKVLRAALAHLDSELSHLC
jgi:hypothetical protein